MNTARGILPAAKASCSAEKRRRRSVRRDVYKRQVLEYEKVKELVKNYEATDYSKFEIVIPDYANLKKPLIEVFTLDSSSCAACTYMMGMANAAKEKYGDKIDVVEYKFTVKENIARVMKMGIKQLPSMLINGELKMCIRDRHDRYEGRNGYDHGHAFGRCGCRRQSDGRHCQDDDGNGKTRNLESRGQH